MQYELARVLAICCLVTAGCDQFATIGVTALMQDSQPMDAGMDALVEPPLPLVDAAMAADAETDAAADGGAQCVAPVIVLCDPVAPVDGCTLCNPVTNVGCADELAMQCAIDVAAPLSGYCIFVGPVSTPECLNTGVTESCAPGSVCVDAQCLKLCFCDSDCPSTQCCSVPIEGLGFSACSTC